MTHAVLTTYDLDDNNSQALNVRLALSGSLEVNATSALPSVVLNTRRVSLVLPTPTLDSRGQPT